MNHLSIYRKINQLPLNLIAEVEDYIDFLLQKNQKVQSSKINKAKAESCKTEEKLADELMAERRQQETSSVQTKQLVLQRQQDILKNITVVWDEEDAKAVEQIQQELNQWKIQTF